MVAHPRVLPVQHFARVAAGSEHSVALTSTGNVWAWGSNRYGEVGESSVATCGRSCGRLCGVTCPWRRTACKTQPHAAFPLGAASLH